MPLDMKKFAQRGGRPDSPHTSRPASRSEIAANAKVNRAELRQPSRQQQHAPTHVQNIEQRAPRGPLNLQHVKFDHQDQYGTDAESIDTTLASVAPPAYPQNGGHDYDSQQNGDAAQYNDDEEEEYEGSEYEQYEEYDNSQYDDQQHIGSHVPEEIRRQVWDLNERGGVHIEGDSYPTTTSGINEDTLLSRQIDDQEQASDDNMSHVSPSPQRPRVNGQLLRPLAQQLNPRPSSAIGLARPRHGSRDLYQEGVANENPGISKFSSTQPAHVQPRTLSDPRLGQPPSHSQVMPPANVYAPKDEGVKQMNPIQNMQALPQRGPGARSRGFVGAAPSNPQPSAQIKVAPSQQIKVASSQQPAMYPTPPAHPTENTHPQSDRPASPTEDYDVSALYNMDYNELRNEDFDTDPRRREPVLSEDMSSKPLDERLQYVQKSLAAEDQAKFFRSLPTAEWEESGDWFLQQFESIIKRTREARQEKRKIARDFEKEIEKRHRHVDKKSRHVDEALQKMSAHGQGLIPPKSPAKR